MKERPIIMSAESIQGILDCRKSMTRRVVTGNALKMLTIVPPAIVARDLSPWKVGDRLWVKETWGIGTRPDPYSGWVDGIEYKADLKYLDEKEDLHLNIIEDKDLSIYEKEGWNSLIYMPRWASRITLEITDIRVERVQDISVQDCQKEGIPMPYVARDKYEPIAMYRTLWQTINAKRGYPWKDNPWVWVVSFKVVTK